MRLLRVNQWMMFFYVFLMSGLPAIQAQHVRLVKWPELEAVINGKNDSTTVLNFWATWCKPCVAELPHFESIRKSHFSNKPVRFLYISLDFAEDKSRLEAFAARKLPGASVWLLDETDYNKWIEKVNPGWSGALPATLVFHPFTNIRIFAEGELHEEKLLSIIHKVTPTK